jgi:hypothetical protein
VIVLLLIGNLDNERRGQYLLTSQAPHVKQHQSILLSWVAHWCSVGVQLWEYLASWNWRPLVRWLKQGGLHAFPINICECSSCIPILLNEGIVPFWFLDQTFAELRGCSSCRYVVVLFLCNHFAVVEQSCFGFWDPVRHMAYFTRVSVVGFCADIIGNAVCFWFEW